MLRTLRGCAGGGFCCCQRLTSSSMRCTFSFASLSSSMAARISKSRCVGSSLIGPPSVGCRNPNPTAPVLGNFRHSVLCQVDHQRLPDYALRLTFAHPYCMPKFSGGMPVRMCFLRVMSFFLVSACSHAKHPRQMAKP